jgi:hypothetical protein
MVDTKKTVLIITHPLYGLEVFMKSINKALISVFLASSFCLSANVSEHEKISEALGSVQTWLSLVDTGNYPQSWKTAGSLIQRRFSDSLWSRRLNQDRLHLGKIISRTEKSTKYKTSLPGAAAGEYIIAVFKPILKRKKMSKKR